MIRRLLRLYPRAWRKRYGDEVEELVASTGGPSVMTAVDLVRGAVGERIRLARRRLAGRPPMTTGDRPGWGSAALAVAGFAALVPTLLFMSFSVLIYNLSVPLETTRPVVETSISIVPVSIGFVVLPFVALALSAAPLIRLSIRSDADRDEAVIRLGLRSLRARLGNLVVTALAAAAIVILVVYHLTENWL